MAIKGRVLTKIPARIVGGVGTSVVLANGIYTITSSATISDGDKGDITVSASGATWTIDSSVISTFGRTLTDDADAATARGTLGLGTIATQAASSVSITGGSISGITDLAVADGGTGASTAADARTNLGLVIGTNVQAFDAELSALAGLTSAADKVPYFTGSGTAALGDFTAAGRSMVGAANAAAQTALLDAFTSALKGLAPASGGGTTNFLRADGTWAAPPGGGGPSVEHTFFPQDNEPPSSNYATLDVRNVHPVLDFDDTTAESAVFTGVLSTGYTAGGITVAVGYSATSATSGTIGWTVEIERIGDQQLDVDSDSFASAQTITAVTVPGTSGNVDVVSVNISDGANMDSLAAGEQFRIRIKRDVANDTATGDAELHWVRITEQ